MGVEGTDHRWQGSLIPRPSPRFISQPFFSTAARYNLGGGLETRLVAAGRESKVKDNYSLQATTASQSAKYM